MIKENIAYEYKIACTHNDIKCWKKKVGGKWYKIKHRHIIKKLK